MADNETLTLFTKEALSPYNKNEVFTVSKADGETLLAKVPEKVERYDAKKHAQYLPTPPATETGDSAKTAEEAAKTSK